MNSGLRPGSRRLDATYSTVGTPRASTGVALRGRNRGPSGQNGPPADPTSEGGERRSSNYPHPAGGSGADRPPIRRKGGFSVQDGLYRVVTTYLCAGFVVENGEIVACAPILRRKLGYWRTVARLVP